MSRWSKQFETWAIEVLLHTRSISDGSRLLRLGWDAFDKMMERGLARRTIAELKLLGIDEKSFRKGQDYIAVMTDLRGARVLEVVQGAGQKEVEALWQTQPEEQREQVRAAISLATELEALDQPQSDGLILLTARAARLVRVLVVTAA